MTALSTGSCTLHCTALYPLVDVQLSIYTSRCTALCTASCTALYPLVDVLLYLLQAVHCTLHCTALYPLVDVLLYLLEAVQLSLTRRCDTVLVRLAPSPHQILQQSDAIQLSARYCQKPIVALAKTFTFQSHSSGNVVHLLPLLVVEPWKY